MSRRRNALLAGLGLVLVAALALGMRPAPVMVDVAEVRRDAFRIEVEEEGRTRVADRYLVSAPVAGYLERVTLEPGDAITPGQRLFAIRPQHAAPLDPRSRAQAEAGLSRAEAALQAATMLVEAEAARSELAERELARVEPLVAAGHLSEGALDLARTEQRRAAAALRSARFNVDVARFERDNARAALAVVGGDASPAVMFVEAPVPGLVLRRLRQSEGAVQAAEAVLELGDLRSLEVEVDVLSPDAVRLRQGMRVLLERWGGEAALEGRVRRVEPSGFTRISALGVEEQRVWVIVDLSPEAMAAGLGDGFRVEARFILWEGEAVLQVPASALFRKGEHWQVYVLEGGRARAREVEPGRRSGLQREVLSGLEPGERVILHPDEQLHDGARVRYRGHY